MRKTVHKSFFIWNFDKEQQWLNQMAAKGLALVSVGFCRYEFEDCVPGEYRVCLQLLEKCPRNLEMQKYIEFLEQTGAEHVGSFARWVYFRKKASEGDFELFSDNASKVKYLTSLLGLITLVVASNLLFGLENLALAIFMEQPGNYIGFLNLAIGLFGLPGTVKLWKKRNRMKKESRLFE